jgi:hypothetical protein
MRTRAFLASTTRFRQRFANISAIIAADALSHDDNKQLS